MGAEIEQGRENRAKEIEYTMELNKKAYDEYVKQITPVNELGSDMHDARRRNLSKSHQGKAESILIFCQSCIQELLPVVESIHSHIPC